MDATRALGGRWLTLAGLVAASLGADTADAGEAPANAREPASRVEPAPSGAARPLVSPCLAAGPEAGAPVRAPLAQSDFGTIPEACAKYEISLRGHLDVLIDEPNFYGSLGLGGALRLRVPLPGGGWVSAALPGVDYKFVANATVEADRVDLSASTLALHVPVTLGSRLAIAPYVRWMLPTESSLNTATRFGFEQGISFVANVHPLFELTGGYALPLTLTTTSLGTHTLLMPSVAIDAGFRPWRWVELMGGLGARFVPAASDEELESLDLRTSLRFYPYEGLLVDLAAILPLEGRDRTNVANALALGWVGGL